MTFPQCYLLRCVYGIIYCRMLKGRGLQQTATRARPGFGFPKLGFACDSGAHAGKIQWTPTVPDHLTIQSDLLNPDMDIPDIWMNEWLNWIELMNWTTFNSDKIDLGLTTSDCTPCCPEFPLLYFLITAKIYSFIRLKKVKRKDKSDYNNGMSS